MFFINEDAIPAPKLVEAHITHQQGRQPAPGLSHSPISSSSETNCSPTTGGFSREELSDDMAGNERPLCRLMCELMRGCDEMPESRGLFYSDFDLLASGCLRTYLLVVIILAPSGLVQVSLKELLSEIRRFVTNNRRIPPGSPKPSKSDLPCLLACFALLLALDLIVHGGFCFYSSTSAGVKARSIRRYRQQQKAESDIPRLLYC